MTFNKHIIGIDNRDKDALKWYSELSPAVIIPTPMQPIELLEELQDTTWVQCTNHGYTTAQELLYRHGSKITNNDPTEWANALNQSTHPYNPSDVINVLALDVDEPREIDPSHFAYNPDYTPSAPLLHRDELIRLLAKLFGHVIYAPSATASTLSAKGRYYIATTTPLTTDEWLLLIRTELFRQHKTANIIHASKSCYSAPTAHEIIDDAIYKGNHRVFTYLNPPTLYKADGTPFNPTTDTPPVAKSVPKIISQCKRDYPYTDPIDVIVDITTQPLRDFIDAREAEEAESKGMTVKELKRSNENAVLKVGTLLYHPRTKTTYTLSEDISSLPAGNYREASNPDKNWLPYYKGSKRNILLKYTGSTSHAVSIETTPDYPVSHHVIEGAYKENIESLSYLTFIEAPTNSGKTYSMLGDDTIILAVPTIALAEELQESNPTKVHYVPAGSPIVAVLNKTMVVTHDKLAHSVGCEDFHIVIDEPHRLFSKERNKYTYMRDKFIQAFMKPYNFKKVTLISAYEGFPYLFSLYDIDPKSTSYQVHMRAEMPNVDIYDNFTKPMLQGRVFGYVNSTAKCKALASHVGGVGVMRHSAVKMHEIDSLPSEVSAIITSIGREGVSLFSSFDNIVIDSRAGGNLSTGADHTAQALARVRDRDVPMHVVHYCKERYRQPVRLQAMYTLAVILAHSDRKREETELVKFLPLFKDVKLAVSEADTASGWNISRLYIVGAYLSLTAERERNDVRAFRDRLEDYGYTTKLHKEVTVGFKYPKGDGEEAIQARDFEEYLELVDQLEDENKREKEIAKIVKLESSEEFDNLADEAKLEILTDVKTAKKYYITPMQVTILEKKGIIGNIMSTVTSFNSKVSKLLTDKEWETAKVPSKMSIDKSLGYLKALGLDFEWYGKDKKPLKVVRGAKGIILSWVDTTNKVYLPEKIKKTTYPIGGYVVVEDIVKFKKELLHD